MSKKKADKLKQDLEKVSHDWEELIGEETLSHNEEFLDQVAHDLISLNEDAKALESDEDFNESAEVITHLLETPWGAPFVSNLTLLDAALNYEDQDPLQSDLCHLMEDFTRYGHQFENQLFKIFEDILDDFEYQSF